MTAASKDLDDIAVQIIKAQFSVFLIGQLERILLYDDGVLKVFDTGPLYEFLHQENSVQGMYGETVLLNPGEKVYDKAFSGIEWLTSMKSLFKDFLSLIGQEYYSPRTTPIPVKPVMQAKRFSAGMWGSAEKGLRGGAIDQRGLVCR